MSNPESEQRCNALRHDLKAWEKKFAAQHGGRKAAREDIKADAAISQKYKEYNKLRDILSGKADPQTPSKRATSRKPPRDLPGTLKTLKPSASTPLKRKRGDDDTDAVEAVDSGAEFLSPQGPAFIGPTPQRNGIVVGLFDLLPAETPSKTRTVLADLAPNLLRTPSKQAGSETSVESKARGERTPCSSGKRFLLDQFVTPKKIKLDEQGTPSSALKEFATPAFLRRDHRLSAIDETDEPTPRPLPWKRRGLGRSLSAMIQSMRKQEEEQLDEEADIMRELEMEADGITLPKKSSVPKLLVEDSQAAMPLGPDGGLGSDDEDDEEEAEDRLGPDGKPRKPWKKKGLKRQTRRVIMRPNFTKPKALPQQAEQEDSEDEATVTETQVPSDTTPRKRKSSDDEDDDSGSEYASDNSHTPKKRKGESKKGESKKIESKKAEKASTEQSKEGKPDKTGPVKTAARKVKATAHANYRRLKIKSKGGNGGKGRFGRRR